MSDNKYTEQELSDANQEISNKLQEAQNLISECVQIADKYNLQFDWDISYGMGGTYYGTGQDNPDCWYKEDSKLEAGTWYASSESC